MKTKLFILLMMLLIFSVFVTSAQGAWDVRTAETLYDHNPGETFTIEVALSGSGSDIDALGFDFHYPEALLQYNSADFSGTLMDAWMFKDVSDMSGGNLRVAGFTTTGIITSGTTGILVKLSFTVKPTVTGEDQLTIDGFTDDLIGSTTSASTFRVRVGDAIIVRMPDTAGAPGQMINIPVMVDDDVTGQGIIAVMLTVRTDVALLTPVGVSIAGTMLEPWGSVESNVVGGDISISGANISELTGSGVLVYIQYQVNASAVPGQTTPLDLLTVLFNEGTPIASLVDGVFTVMSGYSVSGNVEYYNNDRAIANVTLDLDGFQTLTDASGDFVFPAVPGGTYSLVPTKDGDLGASISPFDAAKVLQYSVGVITLTPFQMIAADVSGNGSISPFDASYILRYSVGMIAEFPVGDDWKFIPSSFMINETNWSSAPESIDYSPLSSNMTDQDFAGVVYGDVTGNWVTEGFDGSAGNVELVVGAPENLENGELLIPIEINLTEDAYSGVVRLDYDESAVSFVSSVNQSEQTGLIAASSENQGEIVLAFASPYSLANQKVKLGLVFENITAEGLTNPVLSLTEMKIDDKYAMPTVVDNYRETQAPVSFELFQNHPNPFNPETTISFRLAEETRVTIEIYNQLGQKVKTLLKQEKNAGKHEVKWNGIDDSGQPVVSGVYIYKMIAGEFVANKKMALVR